MTTNDLRLAQLTHWIKNTLDWTDSTIAVASADASFRRYFRVQHNHSSYIAMDAPPDKEDTRPFIDITRRLLKTGAHVPEIIAMNREEGLLMLEDLGDTAYLHVLDNTTADRLYNDALQALLLMQNAELDGLPDYNRQRLLEEMALMPVWLLETHMNLELSDEQSNIINTVFDALLDNILRQPTGFVHRDYHSRNLMLTHERNPGIIDYQDAVRGPLTYDLVSLLRDCYICWPRSRVEDWAAGFQNMAEQAGVLPAMSHEAFLRDFDFMGLQRHIKVLGIFCRLCHRDGKQGYLKDLPLTLGYVMTVGQHYEQTRPLIELFNALQIPERIGSVEIPA